MYLIEKSLTANRYPRHTIAVVIETDTEKRRNNGIRRHYPGQSQGKLTDLCCHVRLLFCRDIHASCFLLFILGGALGGDLVGRKNAVPAQAATGNRGRAIDQ